MEANWRVALAILIASAAVLAADHWRIQYVEGIPKIVLSTIFIVAICAAAVLMVALIRALIWLVFAAIGSLRSIGAEGRMVQRLLGLPPEEQRILVWAKSNNRQTFTASFIEQNLVALTMKGYVVRHGGQHSVLNWPYSIPNEVWNALDTAFSGHPPPKTIAYPFGHL